MEKKYFYLANYENFDIGKKFIARDRVDVDDIHKLALIVTVLVDDLESFLNTNYVNFLEVCFKNNQNNELKIIFDKLKTDMLAMELLSIDIRLCLLENILRKNKYEKQTTEQLIEAYKKLMIDYQVDLEVNNNFYEADYEKILENNGKKRLKF